MYDFKAEYQRLQTRFERFMQEYLEELKTTPAVLGESMAYSLQNGGKRIRPVLMLATAEAFGVEESRVLPFALALEMIHTYSLVHDDLPAMDNDDFRRGKPSNHKVFGEGNAVLAGDALLNTAFGLCLKECFKGQDEVLASSILCECAGIDGMIAGQSADLLFEKNLENAKEKDLLYIQENKTGKLILAAVAVPSVLSGNEYYYQLREYAVTLGRLFQITDDILDVTGDFTALGKTIGKDEREDKLTSIRFYSLDGARVQADVCADRCNAVLDGVKKDLSFLRDFVAMVRNRSK
ncbi:MAG: polyprenyl synthetase family protein [Clostridia bacterium]|nr:polyprenyl synthetase family protein [Clostridia bacterium]